MDAYSISSNHSDNEHGGFSFNNGGEERLTAVERSRERVVLVVAGNKKQRREVAIGGEEVGSDRWET